MPNVFAFLSETYFRFSDHEALEKQVEELETELAELESEPVRFPIICYSYTHTYSCLQDEFTPHQG